MGYDIHIVSSSLPRKCGIATFTQDIVDTLRGFQQTESGLVTPRDLVNSVSIAPIDRYGATYDSSIDPREIIDQNNPESWRAAAKYISEKAKGEEKPVVLLQHEYGLDGSGLGENYTGTDRNYVEMAKIFREHELTTLVYLHTLRDNPVDFEKEVIKGLSDYSDGLVVTTEGVIDRLKEQYGVSEGVIHIDHGTRLMDPPLDRKKIKEDLGLEGRMLLTSLGLRHPNKGLDRGILGFERFLEDSCTKEQKKQFVYVIAGAVHPDFIDLNRGREYREYQAKMDKLLRESGLKVAEIQDVASLKKIGDANLVILDSFLSTEELMNFYGATNMMLMLYRDLDQISSGIMADVLGSGRVAIATELEYAIDLIVNDPEGYTDTPVIGPEHGRGILVGSKTEEQCINEVAMSIRYLVNNEDVRLQMEEHAYERGHEMSWSNVIWKLLHRIDFIESLKQTETRRGIKPELIENTPLEEQLRQVISLKK